MKFQRKITVSDKTRLEEEDRLRREREVEKKAEKVAGERAEYTHGLAIEKRFLMKEPPRRRAS